MGLLDDAIREHLDLKRRRGADPAEVERAEREALGPVRRNRDPGDGFEPEDPSTAGDFAYDQAGDEDWGPDAPAGTDPSVMHDELAQPPSQGDGFAAPESFTEAPPTGGSAGPESPGASLDQDAPMPDWSAAEDEDLAPEFPTASGSQRGLSDISGNETAEFSVEEALAAGREGDGDEDVLEETPEFLQDTPDHDRLWFEQRPPRDFDFDG